MSTDASGARSGRRQSKRTALPDILERVDTSAPTPEDRSAVRAALADAAEAVARVPDAGVLAEGIVISGMCSSESVEEVLRQGAGEVRQKLGFGSAPPLERLLIQEVVLCHLQLGGARMRQGTVNKRGATVTRQTDDEVTAAQRRFLRACETLAKVRKLELKLQLNINNGGQQVNLA